VNLKSSIQKVGSFVYQLAILALILYVGYILFRQININYQTNLKIEKLKQEVSSLEKRNANLDNLLIYYQSKTYRDLEARKRIGMKKAGETALVVPENKDEEVQETEGKQTAEGRQDNQEIPNYLKWLNQIFGKEELILGGV
jgi:cell division protein FtsL